MYLKKKRVILSSIILFYFNFIIRTFTLKQKLGWFYSIYVGMFLEMSPVSLTKTRNALSHVLLSS